MIYNTTGGAAIEIIKYLGAEQFLIKVTPKKGDHYKCQISAKCIEGFNFEEYKRNKRIVESEQLPKTTVTPKIKNKRKRRRK